MNIEVFEGCQTVDEAVAAAQAARRLRFILYVDLRYDGVRIRALSAYSEQDQNKFANQMSVAVTARGGIPERLSRRLEDILGLPFGWFDQDYPERELRCSIARGTRLATKLRFYDLAPRFKKASVMDIISGAPKGERGLSKALYLRAVAHLVPKKKG
ncbi:hypothetical protein ACQKO6_17955 [Pseudomonas monteilii]